MKLRRCDVTILSISLWAASLAAQMRTRTSTVLVRSGDYQLTEKMIQLALHLAQIEAAADFFPSDVAHSELT